MFVQVRSLNSICSQFCDVRPFGQHTDMEFPRITFQSLNGSLAESSLEYVLFFPFDCICLFRLLLAARSWQA